VASRFHEESCGERTDVLADSNGKKPAEKIDLTNLFDMPRTEAPKSPADSIPASLDATSLNILESVTAPADSGGDFDRPMMPSFAFDSAISGLPEIEQSTLDAASGDDHSGTANDSFSSEGRPEEVPLDFTQSTSAFPVSDQEGYVPDPAYASKESTVFSSVSRDEFPVTQTSAPEVAPPLATPVTPPPAVQRIKENLEQIRNFSDKLSPSSTNIPAGIPYSILIDGKLELHEQERLLDIVSRETLGIRTVELEPQLQAGRILIPRISEYAGVQIAQALRNAKVTIRLGLSEKIYQNSELRKDNDALFSPKAPNYVRRMEASRESVEEMLLTTDSEIPGMKIKKILDTFQATLNLRAIHVHSPNSAFFQESLENIKKQLRLKAHHKGADALIRFKTELFPLEDNSQYKLLAEAVAVQFESN
jgi:uncharacterized protein YbjQ (UPF0145 family)